MILFYVKKRQSLMGTNAVLGACVAIHSMCAVERTEVWTEVSAIYLGWCTGGKDIGDENVYTFDRTVSLNVSKTGELRIPGFEAVFAVASLAVACSVLRKRKWT